MSHAAARTLRLDAWFPPLGGWRPSGRPPPVAAQRRAVLAAWRHWAPPAAMPAAARETRPLRRALLMRPSQCWSVARCKGHTRATSTRDARVVVAGVFGAFPSVSQWDWLFTKSHPMNSKYWCINTLAFGIGALLARCLKDGVEDALVPRAGAELEALLLEQLV